MFSKFAFEITLVRDQLGTNPSNPNIHDQHILNKERELILEKNKTNTAVNTYLDAIAISREKGESELNALLDKLEEIFGFAFTKEERADAMAGKLESLRETIKEYSLEGVTVFFWNKALKRPMIGDHMVYGFMKAAAEAIVRTLPKSEQKAGTVMKSASYTQSLINQHVRCEEEFITFDKDIKRDERGRPLYLQRSLRAMTAQGPRVSLAKSEVVEAGAKLKFTLKVLEGSQLDDDEVLKKIFDYGQMTGLGQWRNAGHGMFDYTMKRLGKTK